MCEMVVTRNSQATEKDNSEPNLASNGEIMDTTANAPEHQPLWFKAVMEKLDCLPDMKQQLTDTTRKLSDIQSELKEIKSTADKAYDIAEEAVKRAEVAEKKLEETERENLHMREEMDSIKEKIIKQEAQSRRENLLFDGIQESSTESWSECEAKVRAILVNDLKMESADQIRFERVHRIGPKSITRPRTVIAKFSFYKDREEVWQRRTYLKSTKIWISEDFPAEIKQARRTLYPIFRAAQHTQGVTSASLRLDKLSINGQEYSIKTLSRLPQSLRPENIATRRAGDVTLFFSRNSVFSNFHMNTPIHIDGHDYNCTEQYYQHEKAKFFNDDEKATQILKEKDPYQQFVLGQKVKGFYQSKQRWMPHAREALLKANIAKYDQNVSAKEALLATGSDTLGEASIDTTWGIGFTLNSKSATDKNKWTGQNIMGEILMQVRDQIKHK